MTWPIFAVLQSALMLIGALIVFTLHHRRLSKENAALRDACEASAAEPADAGGEGWEAWLREQIGALGDGDEERIQKLVFENALAPADDFAQRLTSALGNDDGATAWEAARTEAWNLVSAADDAISETARAHFSCYAAIDEHFGFQPEPWPEGEGSEPQAEEPAEEAVVAAEDADPNDLSADAIDALMDTEAESEPQTASDGELDAAALQAENTALKAELEQLKSSGSDEDLRNLLKQFTQDSREMMGCIQDLERENADLKAQLESSAAA